jgi:DNA-binding LytR/AlgR family response regulator
MAGATMPPAQPLRVLVMDDAERLSEAGRRVVEAAESTPDPTVKARDETIAVVLGGVTRFIQRSQVRYVEAHGDYARLHTTTSNHLVRIPLTTLEERWAEAGFVRIHRSTLVALPHVDEIRMDGGRCAVRLGDRVLQVSRRHTRKLRDNLVRAMSLAQENR